ncbi:hypothetical protein J6590_105650, partial [Homalodisca vitripennis]
MEGQTNTQCNFACIYFVQEVSCGHIDSHIVNKFCSPLIPVKPNGGTDAQPNPMVGHAPIPSASLPFYQRTSVTDQDCHLSVTKLPEVRRL